MKTKLVLTVTLTFLLTFIGCSSDSDNTEEGKEIKPPIKAEKVFSFTSNGKTMQGKIYLPDSYKTNDNLPSIYLIDFKEQHFAVATDEFEKVVYAVEQKTGFDALVVTLAVHMDVDLILPGDFQEYSDVFKDMASYVDKHYTNNTSRTFIGRGSEAGQVLMTLFLEEKETSVFQNFIATDTPSMGLIISMIDNQSFPQDKENKKLHYSFSFQESYYDANINLINTINEQDYPWLEFKSVEYPNLTYLNAYPNAFADGINYIFN